MSVRNQEGRSQRNLSGRNSVEVRYVNQHGNLVASKKIAGHRPGRHLDMTNQQVGGLPVPKGYSLNHDQTTVCEFRSRPQRIILLVHGQQVKKQINVHVIKRSQHNHSDSVTPIFISGQVGDYVKVTPRKYVPKGYYIDPADRDQILYINSNAEIVPNHVNFFYDRKGSQPLTLGEITVHYQDSNNLGHDLNLIHVHNYLNRPFAIKKYQRNVPIGTYFVGVSQSAERFTAHPQKVIILVKRFVKGTLVFKDLQNHVINRRPLMSHYPDSSIPYSTLKRYVPQGYRFVKFGQHRQILHDGDTDVMYIKKTATASAPDRQHSQGKIVISYDYNNQLVDRLIKIGAVGKRFNLHHYTHSVPAGYRFANVISGKNVNQFSSSLQMVYIKVTR